MPETLHAAFLIRFPALLLTAGLMTSCAAFRHRPPPAATAPAPAATTHPALPAPASVPTPTPAVHRVGTVRVIGSARRFVLVEVPPNAVGFLPDGLLLRCVADPAAPASVTATLRVGRERRRPYIVADVVNGEPRVGDTVFAVNASAEPPAANNPGALILPTATSGVLPIALPTTANPARP